MDVEDDEAAVFRVKQLDSEEPLLQENPRRFVVFPISYPDVWQFYKKAEGRYRRRFFYFFYIDLLFSQLHFGQ